MSRKSPEQRGDERISRRVFVGGALAGAAAVELLASGCRPRESTPTGPDDDLGPIPKRTLGRTGEQVTILGLGTACMGEGPQSTEECASVFAEAIDRGITYVDTARIYENAEEALGRVLRTRRDKVFLVTKCMTDTRKDAQASFETSLRNLGVDHVDLLHCHSTGDRDIDRVLEPGGMWDYFLELKAEGKTRFLGITGHNRPHKFVRMLETDQVDSMMVAMNFVDRHTYGFEEKVLPVARRHRTGAMAMKVFGGIRGGFAFNRQIRPSQLDPVHLQNAVRYSLSLEGVTGVVIGVHNSEELRQNIRLVRNAAPLSQTEREALTRHGQELAQAWGPRFGPAS